MGNCVNMKSLRQDNQKRVGCDDGRTKNCLDEKHKYGRLTFIGL